MTISSQPTVKTYVCDGVTTGFAFPYRILAAADLLVQRIGVGGEVVEMSPQLYAVSGVGADAGVTVTTGQAYAAGQIRIWLKLSPVQPNTYADNGPFPAQSHEDALDRLTLLSAMRREEFGRTVRVALGEAEGMELPPTAERAGKLFAFNADGRAIAVAQVGGDDMLALADARVFFGINDSAEPRLCLDPGGLGEGDVDAIPGKGGKDQAVVMLQTQAPYVDSSGARVWLSFAFDDFSDADPDARPRSKRSRFGLIVQTRSHLHAPYWDSRPIPRAGDKDFAAFTALVAAKVAQAQIDNPGLTQDDWNGIGYAAALVDWQAGWSARYFPQEVGAASFTAIADVSRLSCKVEGLVVSAREEIPDGVDPADCHPSKGVAVQAITVRATRGPAADDRRQWANADLDALAAEGPSGEGATDGAGTSDPGTSNGSYTLRINGGTTNQAATYYRSWAAMLAGGRAGYLNGICFGGKHHFAGGAGPLDGDGVDGWGGLWGGRSFWHQNTVAIYAKDACPGWITVGHDGVAGTDDDVQNVGRAVAPLDVVVDTGDAPANWTGAVLALNGDALVSERGAAIAAAGADADKITALIARLVAHGLIAAEV